MRVDSRTESTRDTSTGAICTDIHVASALPRAYACHTLSFEFLPSHKTGAARRLTMFTRWLDISRAMNGDGWPDGGEDAALPEASARSDPCIDEWTGTPSSCSLRLRARPSVRLSPGGGGCTISGGSLLSQLALLCQGCSVTLASVAVDGAVRFSVRARAGVEGTDTNASFAAGADAKGAPIHLAQVERVLGAALLVLGCAASTHAAAGSCGAATF